MTGTRAAGAAFPGGQVALAHDDELPPGGELRALLEDVLAEVRGACPPLGHHPPAVVSGAHVVDPPFYGSGDIGRIAVCATVNELAAAGARPLALTLSAVVEAGLPLERLHRLARSVRDAAREADVVIADVDVRVVRAGEADQVYLHTTGIGAFHGAPLRTRDARPGDRVVLSSPLGGHGAHLLSVRRGLGFESLVPSGCAPLAGLLERARAAGSGDGIRAVRTVSRGGLAAALHAYARELGHTLRVEESALPVQYEARMALEAMAVDPLHASSESCLCLLVGPDAVAGVLAALRSHPYGRFAAEIGAVVADGATAVELVRDQGRAVPVTPEPAAFPRLA